VQRVKKFSQGIEGGKRQGFFHVCYDNFSRLMKRLYNGTGLGWYAKDKTCLGLSGLEWIGLLALYRKRGDIQYCTCFFLHLLSLRSLAIQKKGIPASSTRCRSNSPPDLVSSVVSS